MMKSPLAYDRLAKENEIVVHHETVSFPIKRKDNVYIDVDQYIHNAWRAVLDVAVSYGLTGDPKYTLWLFPNAPASFKDQFYTAFNGNTDAADQAFKFFHNDTRLPESTSGTRRKGSPSSSHVHVVLKAVLFLSKAMYQTADGVAFYPRVTLDQFDNPIPVIEEHGKFYKLVQNADGREQKIPLKDSASTMLTFDAFTNVFAQLLQRNRVQEFGSWNGLPSRLFALGEMIKVRGVQYNTSVQMATSYKQELERETGSSDAHKEQLARLRQEETRLNQNRNALLSQVAEQAQEIQGFKQKILELQGQIKDSTGRNTQQQEQTRGQLLQNEAAYKSALKTKEAEYANTLREKEETNRLLVAEVRQNKVRIEELEKTQQTSPTKPDTRASAGVNTQFNLLQRTNERLTVDLATHSRIMAEQTKQIGVLSTKVDRLGVENERLASENERLEADNSVLLKALHSFIELIVSWFMAAPGQVREALNVDVPNAKQATTFAETVEPKMKEVTSLLQVHGVTTSFGAAATEDRAHQSQVGSFQLFSDMEFKN